jgi:hypothetical protein
VSVVGAGGQEPTVLIAAAQTLEKKATKFITAAAKKIAPVRLLISGYHVLSLAPYIVSHSHLNAQNPEATGTIHMSEYKTKEVKFNLEGSISMTRILPLLPAILKENDEPGWEVCSTVIAQFYTLNPITIGIVYRKVSL